MPQLADAGVQGPGGALPYFAQIQRAFGPAHDVSGVSAHVGGGATAACEALGATAYATGHRVAFAAAPDLHTAAHEAAHVVQQARGVQLYGGLGAPDDAFERHADTVADAVVAGHSAAPLLHAMPGGGGGTGAAVQAKFKRNGTELTREAATALLDEQEVTGSERVRLDALNKDEEFHDWDTEVAISPRWIFDELSRWYGELPPALFEVLAGAAKTGRNAAVIDAAVAWIKGNAQVKKASSVAAPRLRAAQGAIFHVKQRLAFGAGNQLLSLQATRGNSDTRAGVIKMHLTPHEEGKGTKSGPLARAAEIGQSGSCREYAALMYKVLVEEMSTPLCSIVRSATIDHTFVVIGDLNAEDAEDVVAADAWPTISQACLLADHFTYRDSPPVQGSLIATTGGAASKFVVGEIAARLTGAKELGAVKAKSFAPNVTRGIMPITYLYQKQPVINMSWMDNPPPARSPSDEKARLEAGTSRPSEEAESGFEAALSTIQSTWEDSSTDDADEIAAKQIRELIERYPDQREDILEAVGNEFGGSIQRLVNGESD